jgi:hypothetical protein
MRFNAHLNTSVHGPPHPFRDARVFLDGLTDIRNVMLQCLFAVNSRSIRKGFLVIPNGKNPKDSNVASVEAMRWALFRHRS